MHTGKATCFATLKDLDAFTKAKAEGMSDTQAFRKGDNGIGCWMDKTAQTYAPMCALHPDDMIAEFGSIPNAKHQKVLVVLADKTTSAVCTVADRLPWERNTKNEACIDLNPAALLELGFDPNDNNFSQQVTWGIIRPGALA